MWGRRAVVGLVAAASVLAPASADAQQHLAREMPPELFEIDQLYIMPHGVFQSYARASVVPLVGGGETAVPLIVGAKVGATRFFEVKVEVRDRFGVDVKEVRTDPLDPFEELPPDTANDVRAKASVRASLPAPPLDLLSASAGLISSLRGDETVLGEFSVGAAHRLESGVFVSTQILHRRGVGSDLGPEGGDIESTAFAGSAMVRGAGAFWSLEGKFQLHGGEQPDAGGITPAVYVPAFLNAGLGIPIRFTTEGTSAGVSLVLGYAINWE